MFSSDVVIIDLAMLAIGLELPIGVEDVEHALGADDIAARDAIVVVLDILQHRILGAVCHFAGGEAVDETVLNRRTRQGPATKGDGFVIPASTLATG